MSQPRPKTCDKKFKAAELKVLKILNKLETLKLSHSYVSKLDVPRKNKQFRVNFRGAKCYSLFFALISVITINLWWAFSEVSTERCLLSLPSAAKPLFRPPENCDMCAGVAGAPRVANISAQEFEQLYAYGAAPVIVTDATGDWPAIAEFSFNFFANFYRDGSKLGRQTNDCFYFPYKSGLDSLGEVFQMDEQRANLSGEPWYVGWSTCRDEETRRLRGYYSRPYFLPAGAESDTLDWVFMGGPGQGAHMHVDSVRHVSWQAQVRGRKLWQLAPPPECLYRCAWISFTVAPGDILVVDTNRWYHQTSVLPGDISITIGAEYD